MAIFSVRQFDQKCDYTVTVKSSINTQIIDQCIDPGIVSPV